MERYSTALPAALAAGRHQWKHIQGWLEHFICGTHPKQNVVGNRDHPTGGKVTEEQFRAGDKAAHVCPFVRDSLDGDYLWIEESDLDDVDEIGKLLIARIRPFKDAAPGHDPVGGDGPAVMPVGLKTLVAFFPNYEVARPGPDEQIDGLHGRAKVEFRAEGLMLGQFYKTCAAPAVYNAGWLHALTAPYLVFAIRYMQRHDKLFIGPDDPGYDTYCKLFGVPER